MSEKKSFSLDSLLTVLIAVMATCMGICGFIDNRGSAYTRPVFDIINEDFFAILVSILLLLAGLGLLASMFMKGIPGIVKKISCIVILLFWILVFIFKDVAGIFDGMDLEEWMTWIPSTIMDFIILVTVAGSTLEGILKK